MCVSDSFVTLIGDQMALRRPVFANSVLTLAGGNCGVVFATFTPGYNQAPPTSTYSCCTSGTGSHCWSAGSWIDIWIDSCTCWAQCIVSVSLLFTSDLWNIPIPIDQVLDGRVVKTHVKIDALPSSGGRPNSSQERIPGTCFCCVT